MIAIRTSLASYLRFSILVAFWGMTSLGQAQNAAGSPPCLGFQSPRPGSIISAPTCTLALAAQCPLERVRLRAEYVSDSSGKAETVQLGELSRPPFKMVWRIDDIPNQLFEGAVIHAEGYSPEGISLSTVVEGVFLCHKPIPTRRSTVPYFHRPISGKPKSREFSFASPDSQTLVTVTPWWTTKWLRFDIKVDDLQFHTALPKEQLSTTGIELMIDRHRTRLPYPSSKSAIVIRVPLEGTPTQILHKPLFSTTGSYQLQRASKVFNYPCSLEVADFEGYSASIYLPMKLFGKERPDSIAANVLVRYIDQEDRMQEASWAPGTGTDQYAPFVWGTLTFGSRYQMRTAALWISTSFATGFIFSLLIGLALPTRRKRFNSLSKSERSEEEHEFLGRISDSIHAVVTDRDARIENVAQSVGLSSTQVNKLLKKNTGSPFLHHLMLARVELAKERLRSSHSSEKFIAESCGFSDVDEMEKFFKKFTGTTPYRFRQEFHVT